MRGRFIYFLGGKGICSSEKLADIEKSGMELHLAVPELCISGYGLSPSLQKVDEKGRVAADLQGMSSPVGDLPEPLRIDGRLFEKFPFSGGEGIQPVDDITEYPGITSPAHGSPPHGLFHMSRG